MKALIIFLLLCITASAQTTWSITYSNHVNDGWKGPVAVSEISEDGSRILRTIPLNYQPFNTNINWVTNQSTKLLVTVIPGNNIAVITNDCFTIITNCSLTHEAITNGTACAARGHEWRIGCGVYGCLVIHGDEPMRYCERCKKTERRELGPWK